MVPWRSTGKPGLHNRALNEATAAATRLEVPRDETVAGNTIRQDGKMARAALAEVEAVEASSVGHLKEVEAEDAVRVRSNAAVVLFRFAGSQVTEDVVKPTNASKIKNPAEAPIPKHKVRIKCEALQGEVGVALRTDHKEAVVFKFAEASQIATPLRTRTLQEATSTSHEAHRTFVVEADSSKPSVERSSSAAIIRSNSNINKETIRALRLLPLLLETRRLRQL